MSAIRVSKYDPAFRDANGRYQRQEWTSVSDVGRRFGRVKLSSRDYLRIERAYICLIACFASMPYVGEFRVVGLEVSSKGGIRRALAEAKEMHLDPVAIDRFPIEGERATLGAIGDLVRLALREYLWFRLESLSGHFAYFGYDYYIYVGGPRVKERLIELSHRLGLFAEHVRKPAFEK